MDSTNFFKDCNTLCEVQLQYAQLVMYHHPKLGGASFIMQEILKDYQMVPFYPLISSSKSFGDKREILLQFQFCLERIINLGLRFRIRGNQIIPIGDLDKFQTELKGLGFDGPPYVLQVTETLTKAGQYENISR